MSCMKSGGSHKDVQTLPQVMMVRDIINIDVMEEEVCKMFAWSKRDGQCENRKDKAQSWHEGKDE